MTVKDASGEGERERRIEQQPQGVTWLDPYAKERISKLLPRASVEETNTLTINEGNSAYFNAIIEYAGILTLLNEKQNNNTSSHLSVTRTFYSPDQIENDAIFGDLFSSRSSPFGRGRLSSTKESMFSLDGSTPRRIIGGLGKNKKSSIHESTRYIPNITMGMGDSLIIWPPPKSLRPSTLMASLPCSRQKRTGKDHFVCTIEKLFGSNSDPESESESESESEGDDAEKEEIDDDEQEQEKIKDYQKEKEKEEKILMKCLDKEIKREDKEYDKIQTMKIGISLYSVGDPINDCGQSLIHKEIMLGTNGTVKQLYLFIKGVLKWRKRFIPPMDSSSYELYRYKLNDRAGYGEWLSDGYYKSRDPNTVILAKGMIEEIFKDANSFYSFDTKDWYRKHGLPHRRCYLFHGPPGTGKTSTIKVLAGELQLTCCFLQFSNHNFTNQLLSDAFKQIPKNSLLVIEDIDSLFNSYDDSKMEGQLTFSGLLNVLDGLLSASGLMTILTTNHPKKLDNALIRGGRIDRAFLFDWPGELEIKRYFCSFYPNYNTHDHLVQQFVDIVWKRKESQKARNISTLQQLFIASRVLSAQECVNNADDFFDSYFSTTVGKEDRTSQYVM